MKDDICVGTWWLDIEKGKKHVVVEIREDGFGVSDLDNVIGFEGPDHVYEYPEDTMKRIVEILKYGRRGNMNRRTFIGSTAVLAAGAAIGSVDFKGIKEHGPVEIRMYFFVKEPIVIKGALFSDEQRDVFGVRVFDEKGETAVAEMRLLDVKEALAEQTVRRLKVTMKNVTDGKREEGSVSIVAKDGNFTFLMDEIGKDPSPIWLKLADVRRVL